MNASDDQDGEPLRQALARALTEGLDSEWQRRAYTSEDVNERVRQLQALGRTDYLSKLKVAGFTATPYRPPEDLELEQSCATCMYFVRHRRHCELPELDVPVLPEWSCVLWRI